MLMKHDHMKHRMTITQGCLGGIILSFNAVKQLTPSYNSQTTTTTTSTIWHLSD